MPTPAASAAATTASRRRLTGPVKSAKGIFDVLCCTDPASRTDSATCPIGLLARSQMGFAGTQMITALRSPECIASVLATSRLGTPLKAARAMSCAPSTVYRAIARLEKEIGVALFDRSPDGWAPTHVGHRIMDLAETIEREAAATELLVLGGNAGFS